MTADNNNSDDLNRLVELGWGFYETQDNNEPAVWRISPPSDANMYIMQYCTDPDVFFRSKEHAISNALGLQNTRDLAKKINAKRQS